MNKFRTRQLSALIEELRCEAKRVSEGAAHGQVRDLPAILADAADSLADAQNYYGAVEAALV